MFRELERKHKQISMEECTELLINETRGVLSVQGDDGYPYGMPMNHWYNPQDGKIYFHCGNIGHRLDSLRRDNKVSFCVFDKGTKTDDHWAYKVKSVIVFGKIEIIDDKDIITDITTKLSYKFIQDDEYIKGEIASSLHRTLLLRLDPEHICGKLVTEA